MKKLIGMCLMFLNSGIAVQAATHLRCDKVKYGHEFSADVEIPDHGIPSIFLTAHSYPSVVQDEGPVGRQKFLVIVTPSDQSDGRDHLRNYELRDPIAGTGYQSIDFTNVYVSENIDGTFRVMLKGPALKNFINPLGKMKFSHCLEQ